MARFFLFTTLFFCFLSLGSSKKKPDKIPISPITNLATTDIPLPCKDTGCKSHFGDEAACVYVLHGNWSLINNEYMINTDYVPHLCRGSFDDCCRCFRRKIPSTTTTTTTTTTPPTTTTTTTTSTTITTPTTTSTTAPVGCIDVDGSCRAAFGGAGACIDVRTGNLSDIDPEVTPLADKCGTGKCCECFKIKTTECCKALNINGDSNNVFHHTETYNGKPVYKLTNSEYCIYYGKQWMLRECSAFYKHGDSLYKYDGVQLLNNANVDCPNEIGGDMYWYRPGGKEVKGFSLSCSKKECCIAIQYGKEVYYLEDKHNKRPVYKDSKKKYCIYYGEQWMVRECSAFYKHGDSLYKFDGVELLNNADVDCPNQIGGDMYWYTPGGKEAKDVSFSCSKKECCIAIKYGKEVYYLEDKHNNRPVYKDSKKAYCIYYGKQWMVRECSAFYKHGDSLYKFDGVELWSIADVDCPNQIGGHMYWYTPGGKEAKDVSFSCVPASG